MINNLPRSAHRAMTEQIKLIVKELNAALNRNYDLIKFDSLDEKQLLQLLVDLLVSLNAGEKLNIEEDDPEMVSVQLLDMLSSVKYRPPAGVEPAKFRGLLLAGDSRTIHHALHWLLANKEQVKKTAYLAKYLKVPTIPTDVASNNIIQDMLQQYQNLTAEFKDIHKRVRMLHKENSTEIINDIKEMAVERDIVIKRLENVQVNLIDVDDKEELLNVSKALRMQQEKEKELSYQYENQTSLLKSSSDQLKRYLNVIHGQSASPKTVNDVIKHLQDEIQLNSYLVKEKFPSESLALQKELNIMQIVTAEQHPTRSDLVVAQDKISSVNSEIEQLVQRRLTAAGPQDDKLAPFRQQATVIRRNKEDSAAKVHELAGALREYEATLADLQSQVRQLVGDTVLRGEELKKYVNSLRAKSSLYKRQRANLSTFKVESGILTRTLYIISAADATVEIALLNHKKLKVEEENAIENELEKPDLGKKSLNDLSKLVAQTAQRLSAVRQDIQPLADQIKPVREEYQSVQAQYEQKKRVFDATSINITSQMEPLKKQIQNLKDDLTKKEEEWKTLRQKITKAETLQEVVISEMKNVSRSLGQPSKMDELKKKAEALDRQVKSLEEDQRAISARQALVEEQTIMWQNMLKLLQCKMRARTQPATRQEKMHITQHSQMLTLT